MESLEHVSNRASMVNFSEMGPQSKWEVDRICSTSGGSLKQCLMHAHKARPEQRIELR
jgi:hypothetical protein